MTDLRQAAQQALEKLEFFAHMKSVSEDTTRLITDLRAALAEPVQEPVACPYCHNSATLGAVYFDQNCAGCVKRMTAPPQRKPLTDDEIAEMWLVILYDTPPSGVHNDGLVPHRLARAIERAHGITE